MAIQTPEDAVAAALRQIGYARTVVDLYDGSLAARVALDYYDQTRDEFLRSADWPFATSNPTALVLLKGPPPPGGYSPIQPWSTIYPPPGWLYEYAYPGDCLELRSVVKPPTALPSLDPRPAVWRNFNDAAPVLTPGNPAPPGGALYPVWSQGEFLGASPTAGGAPAKVIVSNIAKALAIYRRRVTNLALWEPLAVEGFVSLLAEKLAKDPRLAGSPDYAKMAPAETAAAEGAAMGHRG